MWVTVGIRLILVATVTPPFFGTVSPFRVYAFENVPFVNGYRPLAARYDTTYFSPITIETGAASWVVCHPALDDLANATRPKSLPAEDHREPT